VKTAGVVQDKSREKILGGVDVAARIVLAIPGAYYASAACAMLMARTLPAARLDASLWATILSFAVYCALVIWIFAAASALRAAAVVAAIGLAAWFGAGWAA
jgi:hypothetical protein